MQLRYVEAAAPETAERGRVQKAGVPGNSELRHLGGGDGCGDAVTVVAAQAVVDGSGYDSGGNDTCVVCVCVCV